MLDVPEIAAGALTLTAALAWNEAAQSGVRRLAPTPTGDSFSGKFVYAIVVTIIIIVIAMGVKKATMVINGLPGNGPNRPSPPYTEDSNKPYL